MSKKIILIVFVLAIIGGVGYFVWMNNTPAGTTGGEPQGFSLKNFFPFGNSEAITEDIVSNDNGEDSNDEELPPPTNQPAPKLRKVSDSPVAGMVFFNIGSTTYIRYIEKATGNIYETKVSLLELKRLTNTTIPKINRAFWLPQADGVLVQTVSESDLVETSFIKLRAIKATTTETSASYETVISKLPTGIQELSIRPDGKKIAYYLKTGISDWFLSNPDGTEKVNFYQNNIQNWTPQWYSPGSLFITTKADFSSPSYGYILNVNNNQLSKAFGSLMGGSAKADASGKSLIASKATDSSADLYLIKDRKERDLKIKTLSEKCAWDPSDSNYIICGVPKSFPKGNYPNDWYQGKVGTEDLIERINVTSEFLYIVSDPNKDGGYKIDTRDVSVSTKGDYAAFINKNDSTLWLLRIKE